MSDEFWKATAIMVPSIFAFLSFLYSLKNKDKINTLDTKVKVVDTKVDGVDTKLTVVKTKVDNVNVAVKEVHDSVNGKVQQLLDLNKVASEAEGKEKGIAQEKSDQADRENKK